MKRFLIAVLALIFSHAISAQVTFRPENVTEQTARPSILTRLNVEQDSRLDKMLNWNIRQNAAINGMEGFRVEIFFSSEAEAFDKAKKKKIEFLSVYPENTVHIKYDAPNFRVRVGDFRTKNEALKLYQEIKKNYPVAFIVADNIDFPLMKQIKYERPN